MLTRDEIEIAQKLDASSKDKNNPRCDADWDLLVDWFSGYSTALLEIAVRVPEKCCLTCHHYEKKCFSLKELRLYPCRGDDWCPIGGMKEEK